MKKAKTEAERHAKLAERLTLDIPLKAHEAAALVEKSKKKAGAEKILKGVKAGIEAAIKATAPKAAKKIPQRATGTSMGLSTGATWFHCMNAAALQPKTDAEIQAFMQSEFPSNKAYSISDVKMHRGIFNRGDFPQQKTAPETKLVEFVRPATKAPKKDKVQKASGPAEL